MDPTAEITIVHREQFGNTRSTEFPDQISQGSTIRAWHTSFMITGSVMQIKGVGRRRTRDEKVQRVREAFLRIPKKLVHSATRQLQIPRSTVHMVFQKRLCLYVYKIQLLQAIEYRLQIEYRLDVLRARNGAHVEMYP